LQRLLSGRDDVGIPDGVAGDGIDQRAACHRDRRRVEQVGDLGEDGKGPARPEQVLHEVLAGRLQVDQQRHTGPDPVEVGKAEIDPEAPRDGEQVHDSIRRPADGRKRDDGVGEGR
jgi:hypothetical protein